MAKSKSFKKIKIKEKSTGKNKTKKRVKYDKNYINIDNTGSSQVTYTQGNNSPKKTVFKWDGKYDGKNANIHMNLNVHGKKSDSDLKLSNEDLMKILSANVVDTPIDRRLELLDEPISNIYPSNVPVFIDEMPMPMSMPMKEQIMIVSSSSSPSRSHPKKLKKKNKSQKS